MSPRHSHAQFGPGPTPQRPVEGAIDHIGPISISRMIGTIGEASVYAGTTHENADVVVCRWGAGQLTGAGVPRLAQLIESMQGEKAPGLAHVVHGSVGADEAVVAFLCPAGESLERRVARGVASPVEALAGALNIATGLERASAVGVPVGRWDPSFVCSLDERPAWVLQLPGVHGLPHPGRPLLRTLTEAAACAPEAATGALEFETATLEERVATEAYALGATIFYAVTGALPLGGADPDAYLRSQLGSAPRPLAEIAPELDRFRRLDEVLQTCLTCAPTTRPQSYADLRALLEGALREAERLDDDAAFLPARLSDTMEIRRVRLREPEPPARTRKVPERAVQVAALFLLVAILVFLLLWQTRARPRSGGEAQSSVAPRSQTLGAFQPPAAAPSPSAPPPKAAALAR